MQFFVSANPSTTCCDSISRSVTEGSSASQTAASFCCPSYENRLLASTRTELNAALGMYGSPYAAAAAAAGQNYANYFPYSADPSAIYSSLVRVALSSDRARVLRSIDWLIQVTACYWLFWLGERTMLSSWRENNWIIKRNKLKDEGTESSCLLAVKGPTWFNLQ